MRARRSIGQRWTGVQLAQQLPISLVSQSAVRPYSVAHGHSLSSEVAFCQR